jgi:hypothetical protein
VGNTVIIFYVERVVPNAVDGDGPPSGRNV